MIKDNKSKQKDIFAARMTWKNRIILFLVFAILSSIAFLSTIKTIRVIVLLLLFVLLLFSLLLLFFVNIFNKDLKNLVFPKKVPSVAVITYAYNNFKGIEKQIEVLLDLEYPIPYTVYLINDGTFEHLKGKKGLKLITLNKKYFKHGNIKAQVINLGIKQLKEENILCMDGDTFPNKDVLMKMTPILKDNTKAVIGFLTPINKKNILERMQVYEYVLNFGLWSRGLSLLKSMFVVVGALNLIKRETFLEVGGFDIYNIVEDNDIAFKLHGKGYDIGYATDARGLTDVPNTLKKFIRQRVRWYRGAFYTWMTYKRYWFNSKLNLFGTFILPYFLFVNILGAALFLKFIVVALKNFLIYTYFIIYEFIAQHGYHFMFNLSDITNIYFPPLLFLWLISILVMLVFFLVAFDKYNFKLKLNDVPYFILFVLFYGLIVITIYLYSLVLEFIGYEYKW